MSTIQVIKASRLFRQDDVDRGEVEGQIVLSYCMGGSATVLVNAKTCHLSKGSVLTLLPQSLVVVQQDSADLAFIHLVFDFHTLNELMLPTNYNFLNVLVEQPHVRLQEADVLLFEQYMQLFQQQVSLLSIFQDDALRYLLYSFIAQINRVYQQEEEAMQPSTRKDAIVFQFYNLLHQYYLVEKSVGFYADQLKLSPKYLTTLIRQRTGTSISKVIIEMVLIKAKNYIVATDLPIYQISEQLHFADSTTFCRYFKKYVGMSPLDYRQAHR